MKLTHNAIHFNVGTVAELLTLVGEENQVTIVTEEGREGTFVYRSVDVLVNNGGTIFNGWTRQYSGAVNVKWFGAKGDGINDDTVAIQNVLNVYNNIVFPDGIFLITSNITLRNNINIIGNGDSSIIISHVDIQTFTNTTSVGSNLIGVNIKDIYIKNTITGTKTQYDIDLLDPYLCTLTRVKVQSGHTDTMYSNTNKGGIQLQKTVGQTSPCMMNKIKDCFIQNNALRLSGISDSSISGGYYWGHVRGFSINLNDCGAIAISDIEGVIPSQYAGAIYLSGSDTNNQIRISNVEFDGNPTLITGVGIYSSNPSRSVTVSGCTFWNCGKEGVKAIDNIGWSISNNNFWNCNSLDTGTSADIIFIGSTLAPEGNTVSSNSFLIDHTRVNAGYAIQELNSGQSPQYNTYTGNSISGNYASPSSLSILALSSYSSNNDKHIVNSNSNISNIKDRLLVGTAVSPTQSSIGQIMLGNTALLVQNSEIIASAGVMTLSVLAGTSLGFIGTLSVSCSRTNYIPHLTNTVFAVSSYGTTLTATQLHTQNGSGGGCAFTVTMTSQGVIKITDTSTYGSTIYMRAMFNGVISYGG